MVAQNAGWPCQTDAEAALLGPVVVSLIQAIPETWAEFDRDAQTDAQAKALYMLIAAGFVERRSWLRVKFAGHPAAFEIRCQSTGETGMRQALASAFSAMFAAWEEAWNRWTASEVAGGTPFAIESLTPQEWRLTTDGVLARADLAKDPQMVTDFVLKRGFYGPGYRHRTFLIRPPTVEEFMSIAPRMKAGENVGNDTRPPVFGTGVLVEIRETTRQVDQTNVAVMNWGDGADALAKAFAPMFEAMARKEAAAPASVEPVAPPPSADDQPAPPVREKQSTSKGEAEAKLIAALAAHHQYESGSCLNLEPVKNNALARDAKVDRGSASKFFKKHFQGHDQYVRICRNSGKLAYMLATLVGDMSAWELYGRAPMSEGGRGEDS